MKSPWILLLCLWLIGCVPGQDIRSARTSASAVAPTPTPLPPDFPKELYWFSNNQIIPQILQINSSIGTVAYLRGAYVQNFLVLNDNYKNTYCLVVNYNIGIGGAKKQLRVRAQPIEFRNLTTGTKERVLRMDLQDDQINSVQCAGAAPRQIGTAPAVLINNPDVAYKVSTLCPACLGLILSSLDLNLYRFDGASITNNAVGILDFNLTGQSLKIDTSSSSVNPNGDCSQSACSAQGFDCCMQGQCVNDGQVRNGVVQSSAGFIQAASDVALFPERFTNYPQYYYICTVLPSKTPTPTATPDAVQQADLRLKGMIFDYYCLKENAASSTTTHCLVDPSCASGPFSIAQLSSANFTSVNLTSCTTDFATVQNRVWKYCGCKATVATPAPADPQTLCGTYGLKTVVSATNVILDVQCDLPAVQVDPTPLQELNLSISGRRAPQRFFNAAGTPVDQIETLYGTPESETSSASEGTFFYYLDDAGKVSPENDSFNMNAITGQLQVNLSQALPARTVNVEFDQTYIIASISGFYTPCPTCPRDSWFPGFMAHPPSQYGTGLEAVGHTTTRDQWSTNITNGNYEDTLFGRACFLPPTMIPFTHHADTDAIVQRRNRLETQAALFSNGYQRDWWGFNKGALIGSFDGVRWFAIGKGRRVKATSRKLFLAINAPYADLADPVNTNVQVSVDTGFSQAADFDFDFNRNSADPRYNSAGSCQQFHQCEFDKDCVAKLGWEYMCTDVNGYRTLWPKFDANANEVAATETSFSLTQILQGSALPSGSLKRCVYRGAGAPCKRNYTTLGNNLKRFYTCAPNFYCAPLGANFNNNVARNISPLDQILYGQEADILGRPLKYVNEGSNFSGVIRTNLQANGLNQSATLTSTELGVCRPSKSLITTLANPSPLFSHQNTDAVKRTDYINQIASCASTYSNVSGSITRLIRTQTCPTFDVDGNYIYVNSTTGSITVAAEQNEFWKQNSCGLESVNSVSANTFASIEASALPSATQILTPTIVQDACLRRAGNICFSDLDCSPNAMHSSESQKFGVDSFGGTLAEKSYWEEGLVCGQQDPVPFLTSSNFKTFDITLNRCCRPVGQSISTYTQGPDLATATDNPSLNVQLFSAGAPAATGRYSRYTPLGDMTADAPAVVAPIDSPPIMPATGTTPGRYQWKTIHDTNKLTCCGGGWARKFTDGSVNWSNFNRLELNAANFACLNYHTTLPFAKPTGVVTSRYDEDFFKLCMDPSNNGCAQFPLASTTGFNIVNPADPSTDLNANRAILSTFPSNYGTADEVQPLNSYATYQPIVTSRIGVAPSAAIFESLHTYFDPLAYSVSFKLPIYINEAGNTKFNIAAVSISNDGLADTILIGGASDPTAACNPSAWAAAGGPEWCITTNVGQPVMMHVRRAVVGTVQGIRVYFYPSNTALHKYSGASAVADVTRMGMLPGNDLYYMTKLARFELLGVPQIFYEPIYCNSDRSQMVTGLFQQNDGSSITDRSSFENAALTDRYAYNGNDGGIGRIYDPIATILDTSNPSAFVVNESNVAITPIFSAYEFQCCVNLGQKVTSQDRCCSGFAARTGTGTDLFCKLPVAADVSLYFNRFISGDGVGSTQPGGGLVDTDFVPQTGEPRLTDPVFSKLIALGNAYCVSGKTRLGSSVGYFFGEPNNKELIAPRSSPVNSLTRYGLVDSFDDYDANTNETNAPRSINFYNAGFRWAHHVYCNDQ